MLINLSNISFKAQNIKPYEKSDFIQQQKSVSALDLFENTLKYAPENIDEGHIYHSLGKIFENENYFEFANDFFKKNYQFLLSKNVEPKMIEAALMDIDRVESKISEGKKLDIEG